MRIAVIAVFIGERMTLCRTIGLLMGVVGDANPQPGAEIALHLADEVTRSW